MKTAILLIPVAALAVAGCSRTVVKETTKERYAPPTVVEEHVIVEQPAVRERQIIIP